MKVLGLDGSAISTNGRVIIPPNDILNSILSRNVSGEYINDSATAIGGYAFYSCKSLTGVSLTSAASIGAYAFSACTALETFNAPSATSIGSYAFNGCTALQNVNLPAATTITVRAFSGCSALTRLDLPAVTSIGSYAFNGCRELATVILRGSEIVTLQNVTAFNSTPIKNGGTGYVYVPSALVESYQSATGWSTIKNQTRAIEDYPEITSG